MKHISQPATKLVLQAIEKAPVSQRRSRLDIVLQAKMITEEQHQKLVTKLCQEGAA